MIIFSVFSTATLFVFIYLFVKRNWHDTPAVIGLLFKIVAGFSLGLIYKYHYQGGDTFQYFSDAGIIVNYLLDHPGSIFELYFNTSALPEVIDQIAYADHPRALIFAKIVSLLYLVTGGDYWITGAFLSLINFIATFILVQEVTSWYPDLKRATAIAFYFVPSFVFWTSGLLKESLAIGALYILIAVILKMIREKKYKNFPYWISTVLSALVLWELKYFYAAVALPLLFSLLVYSYLSRKSVIPIYLILLVLGISLYAATQLHYNLSLAHVSDVIYQNYLMGIEGSDTKTLEYFYFDGSWLGFLINLPLAAAFGLFRPLIFEASNFFQALVGLENFAVLLLLILGIWKSGMKIRWKDPIFLVAVFYIVFLNVMLAFSTPNFGTLSRYKVGYWPFFVLLVLILNKKDKIKVKFSNLQD